MKNQAREKLIELLIDYGRKIVTNKLQCRGLLSDMIAPEYRIEAKLLRKALDEGVPEALLQLNAARFPIKAQISQLCKRLQDEHFATETATEWAVVSWAIALGVIQKHISPESQESVSSIETSIISSPIFDLISRPAAQNKKSSPHSTTKSNVERLSIVGKKNKIQRYFGICENKIYFGDAISIINFDIFTFQCNIIKIMPGSLNINHVINFLNEKYLIYNNLGDDIFISDISNNNTEIRIKKSNFGSFSNLNINIFQLTSDNLKCLSSTENNLELIELNTGKALATYIGHQNRVTQAMFHPSQKQLLSVDSRGTMKLWDVFSGKCLSSMNDKNGSNGVFQFAPNGETILKSSAEGLVLWDIHLGQPIKYIKGHTAGSTINTIVFTSNSKGALSATEQGEVFLWDLDAGQKFMSYPNEKDSIKSIGLLEDSRLVVVVNSEGTVKIFSLLTGELVYTLFLSENSKILSASLLDRFMAKENGFKQEFLIQTPDRNYTASSPEFAVESLRKENFDSLDIDEYLQHYHHPEIIHQRLNS